MAERGRRDRRAPRVLQVAGAPAHRSGPVRPATWAPDRVAVLAHFATDPEPTRSVIATMRALDEAGYATVIVSTAAAGLGRTCGWAPEPRTLPDATTVLRRANLGHDFGSWAAALATWPGLAKAGRVLLLNDSVLGPLTPLAPVLADFEAGPEPVWGVLGSDQYRPHLQTFLTGYRDGILAEPPLRSFWNGIRVERSKGRVVRYGELGLAEVLDDAGVPWRAMYPATPGGANPSLLQAEELVAAGFPFVKADARGFARPQLAELLAQWRSPAQRAAAADVDPRGSALVHKLRGASFAVEVEGAAGVARRLLRPGRKAP